MSFPHYIESKNVDHEHVVLWQLADYHYEIEFTGGAVVDLPETSFEVAYAKYQITQPRS